MVWPFTATETVLIITTVGGAITSMIAAMRAGEAKAMSGAVKQQTGVIEHKMDVVHQQTNSQLTRLEEKLSAAEAREASLFAALHQAELARRELAASTAENARVAMEQAAAAAAKAVEHAAAQARDLAHRQLAQQQAAEAPIVSTGPITIAQVPSVTVEEAAAVHVQTAKLKRPPPAATGKAEDVNP